MSFKRDICCFDFRSNFLVSISFLINVGKVMSLPGFRKGDIGIAFPVLAAGLSCQVLWLSCILWQCTYRFDTGPL